jgi:beta-N-acetylglucosaminidase
MNNPPAFPANHFDLTVGEHGMTLRDYFAAKAMQGFMANKSNPMHFQPEADASWAYSIADAMLKARETTQGETHV